MQGEPEENLDRYEPARVAAFELEQHLDAAADHFGINPVMFGKLTKEICRLAKENQSQWPRLPDTASMNQINHNPFMTSRITINTPSDIPTANAPPQSRQAEIPHSIFNLPHSQRQINRNTNGSVPRYSRESEKIQDNIDRAVAIADALLREVENDQIPPRTRSEKKY